MSLAAASCSASAWDSWACRSTAARLLLELNGLMLQVLLLVHEIGRLARDPTAEDPEDERQDAQAKRERERRRIIRPPLGGASFGKKEILHVTQLLDGPRDRLELGIPLLSRPRRQWGAPADQRSARDTGATAWLIQIATATWISRAREVLVESSTLCVTSESTAADSSARVAESPAFRIA